MVVPDDPHPKAAWQPRTAVMRAAVILLHLAPGVLAYFLLRVGRQPLQVALGISSAEAQIGIIMTGVMLLMGAATFFCVRLLDGVGPVATLRLIGLNRLDWVAVLLAVAIWLGVLAISSVLSYEESVRTLVDSVDWLALPPWHFQRIDGFTRLPPLLGGLALVANVVGEEMWFRGFLQNKLRFLGRLSWMVAGLLFTLYHVFQAPIAYPGVLGALALAGLWAMRGDLWSCILLHTLLNAAV